MTDDWELVQTAVGEALVREFTRGDFAGSVAFVNSILPLAEEAGHHPDLSISWGTVRVVLTTHSEGGVVTDKDRSLAAEISRIA